jgi:CTP-dependent riboflavin kinase
MTVLQGIVGTGLGAARGWMATDGYLSQFLKVPLHHGTLNVYVKGDHFVIGDGFDPDSARRNGKVRALPCTVNGLDAFIVRNEHGGPAQISMPAPRTLFEIVSEFYLRGKLGLQDESLVELRFNLEDLKDYYQAK